MQQHTRMCLAALMVTIAPGPGCRATGSEWTEEPLRGRHGPPPKLSCLHSAYRSYVKGIEEGQARAPSPPGRWYVVMNSGQRFLWNDGRKKSFEEKLASPDLEDTLSIPYPIGMLEHAPSEGQDPGRIRHETFLASVYGTDEETVAASLEEVTWPWGAAPSVLFNKRNGASKALKAAISQLRQLGPNVTPFLKEPGGTFNWRPIAGTTRHSAHSWAIALDITVARSDYWFWDRRKKKTTDDVPKYRNRIPYEIVEVFERHGFIWGGKWYHYDTMHFEYRPELLASGCRFPDQTP